jgi:hypothetical protein
LSGRSHLIDPHPASGANSGDLVTLIAESLDGLTVIQAYNKQQYFTHVR